MVARAGERGTLPVGCRRNRSGVNGCRRPRHARQGVAGDGAKGLQPVAPFRGCRRRGSQGCRECLERGTLGGLRERERERVADACPPLGAEQWTVHGAFAGIGERQQMAREIAAVDGRDVERLEWLQRLRVVPVIEVAAVPLEAMHRP